MELFGGSLGADDPLVDPSIDSKLCRADERKNSVCMCFSFLLIFLIAYVGVRTDGPPGVSYLVMYCTRITGIPYFKELHVCFPTKLDKMKDIFIKKKL